MSFYRYFRWLSLDVVLGALIFLHFIARIYGTGLSPFIYVALAISIWLIYTIDHLIDARAAKHLDPRRTFHLKYQKPLIFFSGLFGVVGLINVLFLPVEIIRSGALLAACCVLYLMMVYFIPKLWFKEIVVAIGYALGIFLAPLTLKETLEVVDIILISQLAILAAINLLIFSLYDQEEDFKSGFGSMALVMNKQIEWIIYTLAGCLFISTIIILSDPVTPYGSLQVAYLVMAVILVVVTKFRSFFVQAERFRIVGDAVFFVPVIFIIG